MGSVTDGVGEAMGVELVAITVLLVGATEELLVTTDEVTAVVLVTPNTVLLIMTIELVSIILLEIPGTSNDELVTIIDEDEISGGSRKKRKNILPVHHNF